MPDPGSAQPTRVAAVILAAGTSTRLGEPKQLLPLEERPLLQHVIDAARRGGVDEIVVVLGHAAGEIGRALALPPSARVITNPRYAEGQSTSLLAGIDALGPDVGAALVLLGDQPGVDPEAIRAVVAAFKAGAGPIVRARYSGRPGHPVLLARAVWVELRQATGDRGARDLIAASPDRVTSVDMEGAPPADVDTWEDYARLCSS
jgi:CTP:molybdopterin cytidylyltransferase MocA